MAAWADNEPKRGENAISEVRSEEVRRESACLLDGHPLLCLALSMSMAEAEVGRQVARFAPDPLKVPSDLVRAGERSLAGNPVPLELANAYYARLWLLRVDAFREAEENYLVSGEYEDKLPDNRVALSDLIARGEAVLWAVKKNGIAATAADFTIEDLQSTLESLHRTFRCQHGPKNSQETNHLIEQLLDGAKS
jgi:hypothetical protein